MSDLPRSSARQDVDEWLVRATYKDKRITTRRRQRVSRIRELIDHELEEDQKIHGSVPMFHPAYTAENFQRVWRDNYTKRVTQAYQSRYGSGIILGWILQAFLTWLVKRVLDLYFNNPQYSTVSNRKS